MKTLTKEQFEEYLYEIIPQQLFHVMSTDIDPENGARCDEIILIGILDEHPELLQHQNLKWFIDSFLVY